MKTKILESIALCLILLTGLAARAETPLHEASVEQLQAKMAAGELTSRALTQYFLARIEAVDRKGPKLNSIIEVNPDALKIADALDAERRARKVRGPLHGIPVLLKDNIDTGDAMLTTAGSLALVGSKPRGDAFIVKQLRAAGAVILGKTNLSEWANFRSTRSSSGWSGRGGQTRNPYAPDRSPCGSSSGSGSAVAAGLAVFAVGTETNGSIVCPSAVNGIVGVKPTVGLASRSGIIPISASQDTAGPMARTVKDAALLLAGMMGADQEDTATDALKDRALPDLMSGLKPDALRGKRIGVARNMAGFHEGVDVVFEAALKQLTAAGAVLVDPATLKPEGASSKDQFAVLLYEFKDGLNRYLATRDGGPRTLAELIEFNKKEAARELPYFGQEIFLQAQEKGPLTDKDYIEAHQRSRKANREGIDAVLKEHKLDAIVAPTLGPAWVIDLINGDKYIGGGVSTPPAVAGYPHVTVPAGYLHGLPIGLSFIGAAWSEPQLLGLAYGFEQATHARKPPQF